MDANEFLVPQRRLSHCQIKCRMLLALLLHVFQYPATTMEVSFLPYERARISCRKESQSWRLRRRCILRENYLFLKIFAREIAGHAEDFATRQAYLSILFRKNLQNSDLFHQSLLLRVLFLPRESRGEQNWQYWRGFVESNAHPSPHQIDGLWLTIKTAILV